MKATQCTYSFGRWRRDVAARFSIHWYIHVGTPGLLALILVGTCGPFSDGRSRALGYRRRRRADRGLSSRSARRGGSSTSSTGERRVTRCEPVRTLTMTASRGRVPQGRAKSSARLRSILALKNKGGRGRVEFFRRGRIRSRSGRRARGLAGRLVLLLVEPVCSLFVI